MSPEKSLIQTLIERTLIVPNIGVIESKLFNSSSSKVSRQLDIALISVGFVADTELLSHIAQLDKASSVRLCEDIIRAVKTLSGDHVKHNVYFKNFPNDIPDTIEFWSSLIHDTYGEGNEHLWDVNLLELNRYGAYQHTYNEMLQSRKPFVEKIQRKLKLVKLGDTLQSEIDKLFISLAESNVPLNESDRNLLSYIAGLSTKTPDNIPMRENKAIINCAYIADGKSILIDTFADVLRLAAFISDGDVTLQEPTRYKNISKTQRKAILNALHDLPANKIADIKQYKEQTKRLITHLHGANDVKVRKMMDIANGKIKVSSVSSQLNDALSKNDIDKALLTLDKFPGHFIRSLNRLLMSAQLKDIDKINQSLEKALASTSLRVILSLRQYLENRNVDKLGRIFINKKGGTYVLQESLAKLPEDMLAIYIKTIDNHIKTRVENSDMFISPDIRHYALPLSERDRAEGLNVVPRGTESELDIDAEILRLFVYWKEKHHADYDLSLLMLDENFQLVGQVSYTNLRDGSIVHSGDITRAPKGASEFIDIELDMIDAKYLVPQVNIYSGDTFDDAEEAFFGYMLRTKEEKGKPFEAKTVVTKSALYGVNRIALPMLVAKSDNHWKVKQLNLFLKGSPHFNATENNSSQSQVLIESIVKDKYLTLDYIHDMIQDELGTPVPDTEPNERIKLITHTNLHEVILG